MSSDDPGAGSGRTYQGTVDEDRWRVLAVLCLSLVLIVAANSALNVALPTLVRDLGATQTQLQWIVDAYALVFAGLLLPAGALGDRFGRKGTLQTGLIVFAIASLGATLGTAPVHVIAARGLMGVGAALVMPATLSILTVVFPPHERGRAIAIWAGFAGAGASIGPILSGLLLRWFWWGSVFLVNLPIIALALAAGAVLVPTSRDTTRRRLDPVGAALSVIGLAALLFGIIEGPERGWTAPGTIAGFVVGGAVLLLFGWWERRTDEPMLDLRWFRERDFSVGAGTIALAFFAAFGVFFLATQYFQFILGYTPLTAGLAGLPIAAMLVTVAPRSAGLADRFGPNRVVAAGLVLLGLGLTELALTADPGVAYLVLVPGLLGVGAGMALTTAPSTNLILAGLPTDRAGVGSAVNDTTRELGGSLGVAVLGSILAGLYRHRLPLDQLPSQVAELASDSVGTALQVARRLPDAALAGRLADAAESAFTDGFRAAFLVGAAVAFAAALTVRRFGPREAPHRRSGSRAPADGVRPDAREGR